jgi:hypothetical protein
VNPVPKYSIQVARWRVLYIHEVRRTGRARQERNPPMTFPMNTEPNCFDCGDTGLLIYNAEDDCPECCPYCPAGLDPDARAWEALRNAKEG